MKTLTLLLFSSLMVPAKSQDKAPTVHKDEKPAVPQKPATPAAPAPKIKKEVEVMALAIATAIDQYQNEYQRFPEPTSYVKGNDTTTSTDAAETLIRILKGSDDEQNPRKQDFLGDVKAARIVSGRHVSGLVDEEGEMSIVDPWGRYYQIVLDTDYDEQVENPAANPGEAKLKQKAIVWSAGPDQDFDTWADNICSWKKE